MMLTTRQSPAGRRFLCSDLIDHTTLALEFHGRDVVTGHLHLLESSGQSILARRLHDVEPLPLGQVEEAPIGPHDGVTAILHTWGQNLLFHPHLHCVVTGGGLSLDEQCLVAGKRKYFLPVKVLGKMFRGKFLAGLKAAYQAGQVTLPGAGPARGRQDGAMNETRQSLLLRAQTGEANACKDLTDLYRPVIRAWLNRQGVPARDLKDLSQDVLPSVVKHLPALALRPPGRLSLLAAPHRLSAGLALASAISSSDNSAAGLPRFSIFFPGRLGVGRWPTREATDLRRDCSRRRNYCRSSTRSCAAWPPR